MVLQVIQTDESVSLLAQDPSSRLIQQLHDLIQMHSVERLGLRLRQDCGSLFLSRLEFVTAGNHGGRSYLRFVVQAEAQEQNAEPVLATLTLVVDEVRTCFQL